MEPAHVAMKQEFEAVDKLNSRPRKCLGDKTPYEVFDELAGVSIRNLMGYALIT
jgi:IS30 family transposase